jgi:hypothetical protein
MCNENVSATINDVATRHCYFTSMKLMFTNCYLKQLRWQTALRNCLVDSTN